MAPRYITIYRDFFDSNIKTSILTMLIEVSKVSHSTNVYILFTVDHRCLVIVFEFAKLLCTFMHYLKIRLFDIDIAYM